MADPTDIAVDVLATWRLTRLLQVDDITSPARDWIADRAETGNPAAGFVDRMLGCAWCTSVWAAGAVQVARRVHPAIPVALAASQVTGLLAARR